MEKCNAEKAETSLPHDGMSEPYRPKSCYCEEHEKMMQRHYILYPRMWTHRKKGWGKTLAKHCSDENGFRQCESFFMDRSRCRKFPLRLTEKPISMDSFKNVEFLEHGQSKNVWNPCNKALVQGSESFRMDKVATVDER